MAESWQVGKRLKTLIDAHPDMTKEQLGNTMCMWGTAISRIASENDDATLAEAAMDKFHQALTLLGQDEMGPYGMALYGSTSMIVATEKQDRSVLEAALAQFDAAVAMDTPEAFESPFQYAKALKEGSVLVQHLIDATGDENDDNDSGDETGDDEVEDEVSKEDMSEVVLLQAQLTALLATAAPDAIFDLFKQAYELHRENVNALIEMNTFVCRVELTFNEVVPKVLDVLGRNLVAQLKASSSSNELHAHALKVLQCAHHLHDAFGCYSLAALHALPAFVNPTECHVWLDTCESYGVLDDEFQARDFITMKDQDWFGAFAAPNGTLHPVHAELVVAPSAPSPSSSS
ncbi:hypothetical protein DYB25_006700 [Aphanomyces astaci]|uniref:Uncharacterized protein n=1 Tax=Aphanomyces astaci TaxID=112090 RepID=A0A396ZYJ5_APHAT|nr:hypothetical protein DYB25_006700 [Aphanomyces astaci]RHY42433.1 hypothetical protein DYB38_002262 [Aphanomyces astaci]RHY49593.1 hypothetical protein DYB34_007632 [Aphanomyces astaci]